MDGLINKSEKIEDENTEVNGAELQCIKLFYLFIYFFLNYKERYVIVETELNSGMIKTSWLGVFVGSLYIQQRNYFIFSTSQTFFPVHRVDRDVLM